MITGSGFGPLSRTRVFFGSAQAEIQLVSPTEIRAVSPAYHPGEAFVTVYDGSLPSTSVSFHYCGPRIRGLDPDNVSAAGGAAITITGSCFTGATITTFGSAGTALAGTPAMSVLSDSEIRVTAPRAPMACQSVPVQVGVPELGGIAKSPSVSLFYTDPIGCGGDSAKDTCLKGCQADLQECLSTSGQPGGLSKMQCTSIFKSCQKGCGLN